MSLFFKSKPPEIPEEIIPSNWSFSYRCGKDAAIAGAEIWENPNAEPKGMEWSYSSWQAGWCYGKQCMAEEAKQLKDSNYE
jgi:hypothetical protein